MKYKPTTRVITIEFREGSAAGEYDIVVTPELGVVRYGDTVAWSVQGLAQAEQAHIKIGKPHLLDTPGRALRSRGKLVAARPGPVRRTTRRPTLIDGVSFTGPKLDLGTTEPGYYKYDILFDKKVLVDPDLEIRGPKT